MGGPGVERIPMIRRLAGWRFAKFGTVGASGTVVNLATLYAGQEWLFAGIDSPTLRLDVALGFAILVATVNNFSWNRAWTWRDRRSAHTPALAVQFGQYALASWIGISIQFLLTRWLAAHMHYLVANLLAIVAASVFNYVVNDLWTFGRFRRRGAPLLPPRPGLATTDATWPLAWYAATLVLAVVTYFTGLGSLHIPKNGDEFVYAHITRVTAERGHLLPLESDLDRMRNTKPPLLFWQGIASTRGGTDWTLWNLRYPGAVYTCLTALMAGVLAWRISGGLSTGLVAALAFLAFFSTYRYGRPFLTNPPETFWLSLPFFLLAFTRPAGVASRALVPFCAGIALGVACLYKSFALVVPAAAGLAWWYLHERRYRLGAFLRRDAPKVAITCVVALAMFAGWFALDPEPAEIWREFVVGENVGKFDGGASYIARLLWGGSSVWRLAVGYLENAGLAAALVLALFVVAWRQRRSASSDERLLWIWVATLFIVFALPSQRSSRYLLAAMPFVAVLVALHWDRIPRLAFAATLVISGTAVGVLAWLAHGLQAALPDEVLFGWMFTAIVAAVALVVVVGLASRRLARPMTPVALVSGLLAWSLFLEPFDGTRGTYGPSARQATTGRDVWVPCNFRAMHERYRFLLPDANVLGYRMDEPAAPYLARGLVAMQVPLDAAPCEGCKVIGERLDLRGRHDADAFRRIVGGDVLGQLFVRELLVDAGASTGVTRAHPEESACR